jgi:hypothetical protein
MIYASIICGIGGIGWFLSLEAIRGRRSISSTRVFQLQLAAVLGSLVLEIMAIVFLMVALKTMRH